MKKLVFVIISVLFVFIFSGCVSAPKEPVSVIQTVKEVSKTTIDFGSYWTGTIRLEKEVQSDLGDNSQVRFYSEWTLGESAGNVYPKKFTSIDGGDEEKMASNWDNGGDINAGTYSVLVDIDGMPRIGTINNLKLDKGIVYNVYILFKAAKLDVQLETDGDDIFIFPSGTHDKYEDLGRLDNIPGELTINHVNSYTERNPIYWLIPAGIPLDVLRTYSNGESTWFKDYIATPESFIKQLQ